MSGRDAWDAYKAAAAEMARAAQQVIDAWDQRPAAFRALRAISGSDLPAAIERLRASLEAGRLPSNQGRSV